ncbi:MAG: hypothetical protein AVDCRST_MAG26-3545, partial [uncultured Chloroflexia bacterium]
WPSTNLFQTWTSSSRRSARPGGGSATSMQAKERPAISRS